MSDQGFIERYTKKHPHVVNGTKESISLFGAEFASGAISLGTVAVADIIAPNLLKDAGKALSKTCVEPYLDSIENGLSKACRLEECKPDKNQPPAERAEGLSRTLIVFGAAWAASFIGKIATRMLLNKAMGVPHEKEPLSKNWFKDKVIFRWMNRHDWKVIGWDEGTHLGAVILVNMGLPKQTDHLINTTSNMLQTTLGLPKKKSKEIADMAVIWELPNALGLLAGLGSIVHTHYQNAYPRG